ncbi:MAG: PD-(D/E)XK nuclease family protein [Magnetococcus sp. WYHC-3]
MSSEKQIELSNSKRTCFDTCHKKFYYSYLYEDVGLEEKLPPSPLRLGSAIHTVLMHHYSGASAEIAVQAGVATYNSIFEDIEILITEKEATAIDKEIAIVEGFIKPYTDFWADEDAEFKIMATELDLSTSISPQVRYSGRLDLVVERKGQLYVVDHKTLSMFRAPYFNRLHFDYQLTGYAWLAAKHFKQPVGVIYNCIKKPAIRQKMHETKPEFLARIRDVYDDDPQDYFKRVECVRTLDQINEFKLACAEVASDMIFAINSGTNYRRNMATCDIYSGCIFNGMCVSNTPDLTNFRLRRTRTEEDVDGNDEW